MAKTLLSDISADDLNLPTYLRTVLRNRGLVTARDLAALSEDDLRTVPGVAGMSIRKIKMALAERGLAFRPAGGGGYRGASKPAHQKESALVPTRKHRQTVRRRPPA